MRKVWNCEFCIIELKWNTGNLLLLALGIMQATAVNFGYRKCECQQKHQWEGTGLNNTLIVVNLEKGRPYAGKTTK